MPETTVQFSDIRFGFNLRNPLFEALSLSLTNSSAAGHIVALAGPSGVGKTTLCELVMGIHRPQKGSITFTPANPNVALIPQRGVIFDELSVRDNITCLKYSKNLGSSFREERVTHALESLNLLGVIENATPAARLSGGEAQRVMLARIQTVDCDILVLDEPCSFLDNRVKNSFLGALRATVDERKLLALMVTHVWDEVRAVADEVLFFHRASTKNVTIHRSGVMEFAQRPPTIDALFAIHWPDCSLVELSSGRGSLTIPENSIPEQARSLGLFRGNDVQTAPPQWVLGAWEQAAHPLRTRNSFCPDRTTEAVGISFAFYDKDGIIIAP